MKRIPPGNVVDGDIERDRAQPADVDHGVVVAAAVVIDIVVVGTDNNKFPAPETWPSLGKLKIGDVRDVGKEMRIRGKKNTRRKVESTHVES